MSNGPNLSEDACYAALLARDARFDGRIFVGVTSTGVYCRPVCRVRTPRRENCRFFGSPAQAEAERFRPCMKCRPEIAPRADQLAWTTMDASRTLARQAAEWLDRCDDPQASVEQLAGHLGISSRHLRRIFAIEHGVTPLQYLQTRRLLLAKALLTDSALSVGDVAHAAGFASVRRFNAVFFERYRLQPSALRRLGGGHAEPAPLRLAYRAPYDVAGVLAFLAPRAVAGVEQVSAVGIQRSVALDHAGQRYRGWLNVRFDRPGEVSIALSGGLWPAMAALLPLLRGWLDLDADPQAIAAVLGPDATEGQRLPGCLDRFELAVRAILGQQITVAAARTLAGRLVERFGELLPDADQAPVGCSRVFPDARTLAVATRDEIASLGIIGRRAQSLIALAQAWPHLAYARREGSPEAAAAELEQLPGIGPWTASYMLMRGWSWPDAFPPGDVILRRMLSDDGALLAPQAYLAAAEKYRPFRSYAVVHLWRNA